MPMFFARRNPDHVARPDFLHRSTLGLDPADAGDYVQRLAQRVGMPCRPRTRLERYPVRGNPRRSLGCDDRVLPDGTGEILIGGSARRPRTGEMNLHGIPPCAIGAVPARPGCFFEAA